MILVFSIVAYQNPSIRQIGIFLAYFTTVDKKSGKDECQRHMLRRIPCHIIDCCRLIDVDNFIFQKKRQSFKFSAALVLAISEVRKFLNSAMQERMTDKILHGGVRHAQAVSLL